MTKIARHEVENGRPNPLGKDGGKVCDFFEDVIDECAEDKSRFISIYQAKIGADDKKLQWLIIKGNKRGKIKWHFLWKV